MITKFILRLIAECQILGFEQFATLTTKESICSKRRNLSRPLETKGEWGGREEEKGVLGVNVMLPRIKEL